jgi:hypothetical protein
MAEIKVPLSKDYQSHDKAFNEIVLREPTYTEICMEGLGRPQEWQRMADGSAMLITYPAVVDGYLKKIVVSPGYENITALSAKDTIKLQEAVCSFFI